MAFSCKSRGVCPSCSARRMHDTAAHLVDAVFPRVPVRQWVLSLPRWARWLLARDSPLASREMAIALRAIFAHYRRLERKGGFGAVTFIQRFGGSLDLNLHFHCALPDGVFVRDETGVRFVPARPPTDEEVHKVLLRIARKLHGLILPKQPEDPIDALDAGYAESVRSIASEKHDGTRDFVHTHIRRSGVSLDFGDKGRSCECAQLVTSPSLAARLLPARASPGGYHHQPRRQRLCRRRRSCTSRPVH